MCLVTDVFLIVRDEHVVYFPCGFVIAYILRKGIRAEVVNASSDKLVEVRKRSLRISACCKGVVACSCNVLHRVDEGSVKVKNYKFCHIFLCCAMFRHIGVLLLHYKLKDKSIMNTDNTLSYISSMISSDDSYRTLLDMISEMDLELTGVSLA